MNTVPVPPPKTGFSFKQLAAVAVGVMLLAVAGTALAVKIWFFPQPFKPVELNQQEEQRNGWRKSWSSWLRPAVTCRQKMLKRTGGYSLSHILRKGTAEKLASASGRSTVCWRKTLIWLTSWPWILQKI